MWRNTRLFILFTTRHRPRGRLSVILLTLAATTVGCSAPPLNLHPPRDESDVLSDVVQLTSGFTRAGEAYFSPGQRWIVFQASTQADPNYAMYLARLRRGGESGGSIIGIDQPVRISPKNSKNTCGFFSPDGNSLIFASTAGKESSPASQPATSAAGYQRSTGTYRWDFPAEMEMFRADGWEGAGRAGESSATHAIDLAKHPITQNNAYDAECAYSPDGRWIIFTSNRSGDLELYVMRPDGSDAVQLTHSKGYDGGPFFSPDGKRIVYRSDRVGNDLLQIFTAELVFDRTNRITGIRRERQLTNDENVNWGPYWHPDGRHIIYATSAHGHQNYELYLMRDDGSRKTRITFTDGFDGLPVFSPDGKYLMWSSKRSPDHTTQIFAARFKMPAGS